MSSSPPSYGSTQSTPVPNNSQPARPGQLSTSSSSSLSSRALAIRAAHRLTSNPGGVSSFHPDDSALSPTSIEIHPSSNPFGDAGITGAGARSMNSPVRFKDVDPMESRSYRGETTHRGPIVNIDSPDDEGGINGLPPPGIPISASIRFRPPRKSIDAGRLARQHSHQSQHRPSRAPSSVQSSPMLHPRSARQSSASGTAKPRYRWLSQSGGGTGDEPGVDVRSRRDEEAYGGLKGKTVVTVVDYANAQEKSPAGPSGAGGTNGMNTGEDSEEEEEDGDMNFRVEFPGERLGEWLDGEGKRKVGADGKNIGVRWIHVQGLNWEVIKTLTLRYNLHPLAVEDALRASNSPRSKLDFYRSHLYLQLLIHHIHDSDEEAIEAALAGDVFHEEDDEENDPDHEPDPSLLGGRGGAGDAESGIGLHTTPGGGIGNIVQPKRKSTIDRLKKVLGGSSGGGAGLGGLSKSTGLGASLSGLRLPEGVEGVFEPSVQGTKLQGGESPYQKEAHRLTVDQLSAKYMVPIRRRLISIFMTRDGTIITLSQRRFREVVNPIYQRLEDDQSLLRRSADVSMLAQAFLDIAADLAVEVSQVFEAQILNLEASVLVDPQIDTVRHLHVLSSQLIRLRRSITPLLHITCNIRDQDVQRSAAASAIPIKNERGGSVISLAGTPALNNSGGTGPHGNSTVSLTIPETSALGANTTMGGSAPRGGMGVPGWATPREEFGSNRSFIPSSSSPIPQSTPNTAAAQGSLGGQGQQGQPGGYFSPLTKVYVGDVLDHLEMVVSSMDQFVATCDHLTDYVFNVLSFQTNESMERLSIVTVIFLPLTFISSFFGMNFIDFPEINQSVNYFWKVAAPSTFLFFMIFSFSYIRTFFETGWRRTQRWRSRKEAEGRFKRGTAGIKGE